MKAPPKRPAGTRASGLDLILGNDPAVVALRHNLARVAQFEHMPVLIQGETGTGKELVAQALHDLSCPDEPFVSANCAALPEQLFETELFGHSAHAFTHSEGKREGLLERGGRGTVFLDEVGELSLSLQPKLLRVLEARTFRPVGSTRELAVRARIVSATNAPLGEQADEFRPDLFFRLAGYTIVCPPLRQRRGDIADLAQHFLSAFCTTYGIGNLTFDPAALELLRSHDFPGNVRELRGIVETAAVGSVSSLIRPTDIEAILRPVGLPATRRPPLDPSYFDELPAAAENRLPSSAPRSALRAVDAPLVGPGRRFASLPELERHVIVEAFVDAGGKLSQAARSLGIARSTLRDKLQRYGLTPDRVVSAANLSAKVGGSRAQPSNSDTRSEETRANARRS